MPILENPNFCGEYDFNFLFSTEQKLIYDLVYKAQEAGINESKVGNKFSDPNNITKKIINKGLAELGIINTSGSKHMYYPHGASHFIGLDVHYL